MKKLLFATISLLLLVSCASNEDAVDFENPQYTIDSFIQVDNLLLQSYIYKGDYCIEVLDLKDNLLFTIREKAEDYIWDKDFGEKELFPVNGCYLLDALEKDGNLYVLISLYNKQSYHPHKFILKIKDGEVLKKAYFDNNDWHKSLFFPERMIDWYEGYIAIYVTNKTSYNDIAILDKDLKYLNNGYSSGADIWIENIEKKNYIPSSPNNIIYIAGNKVICADTSKSQHECTIWETMFTEEEIRLINADYSLDENIVAIDVKGVVRSGETKRFHLVLNKNTGELLSV